MSNKELAILIPERTDPLSRIKKFMSFEESGVILTDKEEKMLARWTFCKGLLCERKFTREQIEQKIKDHFGVSVYTARNDINATYSLFTTVTEDYKRFTLVHHIEFLNLEMQRYSRDKSLIALVPKIAAEITKATAALQVLPTADPIPAPIILLQVKGEEDNTIGDIDDLRQQADELIEFEKTKEYTDFEELNDDEDEE